MTSSILQQILIWHTFSKASFLIQTFKDQKCLHQLHPFRAPNRIMTGVNGTGSNRGWQQLLESQPGDPSWVKTFGKADKNHLNIQVILVASWEGSHIPSHWKVLLSRWFSELPKVAYGPVPCRVGMIRCPWLGDKNDDLHPKSPETKWASELEI